MKFLHLPLLVIFPLLAGCGGNDPVPDAEDAASAPAIEASVNQAEEIAVNAQLNAAGDPADPEAQERVAENLVEGVAESNDRVVPPAQPPG